jgi:hypothetical protein
MITVRGENPETVPLPELQDFIYYKQVKTFSEDEYKKSNSLKTAISKGSVIVLKRVNEKFSNFEVPEGLKDTAINKDSSDLNPLFDLLKNLESKIDQSNTSNNSNITIDLLVQKIDALEKKLQGPVPSDNSALLDTIHKLEEKVNQTTNNPAFQKLEEVLLKLSGISSKMSPDKKVEIEEHQEVYVPSIKVEDGNSHINLKVRTIERSDDINSAAAALKKIKKST